MDSATEVLALAFALYHALGVFVSTSAIAVSAYAPDSRAAKVLTFLAHVLPANVAALTEGK